MTDPADRIYEQILIVRCQTGDEAAFGELVARYGPRLRYFLRKLLADSDRADDLLQEVWCDICRYLPRLAEVTAFPAWAYRIARDKAYADLRRRRRLPALVENDQLAEISDDTEAFSRDEAARIHAALDRLPAAQREVIVLRFLEDLAYEDIARIVRCPVGTVRSRLHHAKQSLRRLLDEDSD